MGGTDFDEGGGGLGDGVDGCSACDAADIEGGAGGGGGGGIGDTLTEFVEGVAENEDGVWVVVVGPGVAAGADEGDTEPEAAEGSGDDGGVAAAFEDDGGGDAVVVRGLGEDLAHSAEVSLAFFAYVGSEEDGDGWLDVGVAKGGGDGEEAGEAGGVVTDPWSVDAGGVEIFAGGDGGVEGEDGVEVCGEEEAGDVGIETGIGGEFGESVSGGVEVDVGEA